VLYVEFGSVLDKRKKQRTIRNQNCRAVSTSISQSITRDILWLPFTVAEGGALLFTAAVPVAPPALAGAETGTGRASVAEADDEAVLVLALASLADAAVAVAAVPVFYYTYITAIARREQKQKNRTEEMR
jgi:hypothetical protein